MYGNDWGYGDDWVCGEGEFVFFYYCCDGVCLYVCLFSCLIRWLRCCVLFCVWWWSECLVCVFVLVVDWFGLGLGILVGWWYWCLGCWCFFCGIFLVFFCCCRWFIVWWLCWLVWMWFLYCICFWDDRLLYWIVVCWLFLGLGCCLLVDGRIGLCFFWIIVLDFFVIVWVLVGCVGVCGGIVLVWSLECWWSLLFCFWWMYCWLKWCCGCGCWLYC